jgi:hypothetical protein
VLSRMKSLGECCTADGGSVLVVLRNGLVVRVFCVRSGCGGKKRRRARWREDVGAGGGEETTHVYDLRIGGMSTVVKG